MSWRRHARDATGQKQHLSAEGHLSHSHRPNIRQLVSLSLYGNPLPTPMWNSVSNHASGKQWASTHFYQRT